MSESNKSEIPIQEPKVDLFEKLLQYVYSGEMKFNETNDAVEMMIMADKYVFTELQNSIANHLEKILSIGNFCSIYSAAFICSSPDLMAKCLSMVDSKPMEILKLDGLSDLDLNAFTELIRRESFKPAQMELFVAISKWIAANKDEDAAGLLLSNIRLEAMPMGFLLHTVRPSKLFTASRILDVVTARFGSTSEGENGESLPTSLQLSVIIQHTINNKIHLKKIVLANQHPFDSIARVKRQVRVQYSAAYSSLLLYYGGTLLKDDYNLECYGIPDGGQLFALCK